MTPTPEQIEAAAKVIFDYLKPLEVLLPLPRTDANELASRVLTAAAEVGEKPPHFWSGAEDVRLATIDACAQVADKLLASVEAKGGENFGVISEALIEAAAAIRALKDA